ncbi:hypothetical protein [Chitinophaga sp. Cy-1792]|uniref:hypothetical protein n=1 Tax=Chitinophaga sp. Cy-1792 TaxID=2608339 RepID=UPI00142269DF|nr:hypothetical protein [Chitinophaga sp. Cy-1792]NIG52607.1 hypothetical protein [Chitinophaga sp. Cy-1792]
MSISKKRALAAGVMMATAMAVTFTACKKDDDNKPTPRQTTFKVQGIGADKQVDKAIITLSENQDSSVTLKLQLTKSTKDAAQFIYLLGGTPDAPKTDTFFVATGDAVKGTGAAMPVPMYANVKTIKSYTATGAKDIAFRYDDVVKLAAHLKVLSGTAKDTAAIGVIKTGN